MAELKKRRKRKKKRQQRILAGLICAAAGLIAVYIGFSVYFETHFFPHTVILGLDCGGREISYVEEKLADNAASYLLSVYDRTGDKNLVRGVDIDCKFEDSGEVAEILAEQTGFLFPSKLSGEKEYDLHYSMHYDADRLRAIVLGFPFMQPENMTAPENAQLTITDTGYELIPEDPGTTVIEPQVLSEITDAIEAQEALLTLSDACYEKPEITTDTPSISLITDTMDSYMNAEITYDVGDQDLKLTSADIAGLLDISEDCNVTIDEGKVADFVQQMAYALNTYGRPRSFQTARGDTITIGGGDYGWVVDKTGEAAQILADLYAGMPVTREPVYEQTALYRGEDDIGDTYVEIDYTNQHLYYFKEGTLASETDIVSGNISRSNGSPDGVFKIVYKQSPATLVGEDYESEVTYFMPFAYNVGIHDADWRSSFGGEIYKTSGSHGCINVPKSAAEELYGIVEKGTPVIAYYRDAVTLTAENARISNAYSYDKEAAEQKQQADQAASDAAAAQAAAEQAALAAMLSGVVPQ